MLYRTAKQEKEELEFAAMASDLGIAVNKYNASELNEMEDVTVDALGGILFPGDAHISPSNFMQDMIHNLKRRGVGFVTGEELISINASGDKVSSIKTTSHDIPIETLVITGGSWTSNLLKFLKIKLLLQPGKGYSITYAQHNTMPKYPTILTEGKVAVTPLGQDLRIGGTLELGSFDNQINKNRLQGIKESMQQYYPDLNLKAQENEIWIGYRPCSPDGLPYIGKALPFKNLFVGTGHGMMGMSMGPATGKLLSQIIANEDRDLKFEQAFSINR
jgi:D-amino-acid dehydrogenase